MHNKPHSEETRNKIAFKLSGGKIKQDIVCPICGSVFKSYQGRRKYCSKICSDIGKYGKKLNYKKPEQRKKKISKTLVKWYKTEEGKKKRKALREKMRKSPRFKIITDTKPHLMLVNLLEELGYKVMKEAIFGQFFIDCYVPELHLGFEADGPFHIKEKDNKRDAILLKKYFLPIGRFSAEILMDEDKSKVKNKLQKFICRCCADTKKNDLRIEKFNNLKMKINYAKPVKRYFNPGAEFSKSRKGKSNKEVYGFAKAQEMSNKISAAQKGKKVTIESRKKISDAKILFYSKLKEKHICLVCNKEFITGSNSKKIFCSQKCYHVKACGSRLNKSWEERVCRNCDNSFKVRKKVATKYCSKKCYLDFLKKYGKRGV
jgi:very-short-patch-repair endonuclease